MSYTKRACQVFWMMTLAWGSIAWGVQMPQAINNEKDLRAALKAAKTPEDHTRIAVYCKAKAENLDSRALGYEQSAATIRNGPVVKNLMAPNTAARYEAIAKGYRQEAESDREMAASQDQTARVKEMASK
jgi:hypothetical protein